MPRPRRPARARPPAPPAREAVLEIVEVGARGDGIADAPGEGQAFVPFTLPGERVRARVAGGRGELLGLERASPERAEPPCPHFGRCGGCQLQHWAEPPYLAWKREQVVRALARRGLDVHVEPAVPAWGEGRRRATLHARRVVGGVVLGFTERAGARIVDLEACPVLAPALARALPGLRRIAERFAPARGELSVHVLASETGLDVDLGGAGSVDGLDRRAREDGAELAQALDLARLSFEGETLLERRAPVVTMGAARAAPPPGAFLQATAAAEAALARLVEEGLAGGEGRPPQRVADLFSGVGTFALRIAARAEVHAVEMDEGMFDSLGRAARAVPGLRPVTTERRDLMAEPLTPPELSRFDAVVLDPPRAGARAQSEALARSAVPRVVLASCDPATFARDLRILADGGYVIELVAPVDQFRWSAHLEVVAALRRGGG